MISENIKNALLEQITHEYYSHYFYKQIGHIMTREKLFGVANYFYKAADEEKTHADKIEKYLILNNCCIEYFTINKPQLLKEKYELLDYFKESLLHEMKITASLKNIFSLATKENDSATQDFLDWFIMEQVEEEYKQTVFIERFDLFKGVPSFIYDLDHELK